MDFIGRINGSKSLRDLNQDREQEEKNNQHSSIGRIFRDSRKESKGSFNKSKVNIILDKTEELLESDEDEGVHQENSKASNDHRSQNYNKFHSYHRKSISKLNRLLETTTEASGNKQDPYMGNTQLSRINKYDKFIRGTNPLGIATSGVSPKLKVKVFTESSQERYRKNLKINGKIQLKRSQNSSIIEKSIDRNSTQNKTDSDGKVGYSSFTTSLLSNGNTLNATSPVNISLKNKMLNSTTGFQSSSRILFTPEGNKGESVSQNFFSSNKFTKSAASLRMITSIQRKNQSPPSILFQEQSSQENSQHHTKSPTEEDLDFRRNISSKKKTLRRVNKQGTTCPTSHSIRLKNSQSVLQLQPEIPFLEEMNTNFINSLRLINISEMKKFEFKDNNSTNFSSIISDPPKQATKELLFKQNVHSLEQQLKLGKNNIIELGMNEFTYFSIRVKGQPCPLRVKIQQDQAFTFKLLASRESQTPSQFNCDFKLQGNMFSFDPEDNYSIFSKQEFFYFAIYSSSESFIKITFSFGNTHDHDPHRQRSIKTEEKSSIQAKSAIKIKVQDLTNAQLKKDVLHILEKRKMKIGMVGFGKNLIQRNIDIIKEQNTQETIIQKMNEIEQKKFKLAQVQEHKNFLVESHINQLTQQMENKEMKKKCQIMSKLLEIKQFQKKTFDFIWITNIVLTITVRNIANRLKKHKQRQRVMRDMAFSLLRPFFRYRTRSKSIGGGNIYSRALMNSRFILSIYVKAKKHKMREGAKAVIISALYANTWRHEAIQKVEGYIQNSKKIFRILQQFSFKINSFKQLILLLWEKYYYDIVEEILELKSDLSQPKDKNLLKRLAHNAYQSFNLIEFKKASIDQYSKLVLDRFVQKLIIPKRNVGNTPSLALSSVEPTPRLEEQDNPQNFFKTQIHLSPHSQQQETKSKSNQLSISSPQVLQEQKCQSPKSDTTTERANQQKKEQQNLRLFIMPNRQQLKDIIYYAVKAVGQNYQELQRKVNFKYHPQ